MQTEKIAQYDDDKGLTMQEAISQATKKDLRILNNKELSERLINSEKWKSEKELYPCWTGTLCIYEKPNKAFGKIVEFEGLTAKIPKRFQGKKNMVILCNHPNFTLKENEITLDKKAKAISIPKENGRYVPEKEFDFPTGRKGECSEERRRLWRRDYAYVGLVARYYYGFGDDRRDVSCYFGPADRCGVLGTKGIKHKHVWKTTCEVCGAKKK